MKNGSLPIADVTHCMRLCTQQDYTFFADRQTQFLLDAGRKLDRYTSRVEDDHVTPRWGWLPMGAVRDTGLWFFFSALLGALDFMSFCFLFLSVWDFTNFLTAVLWRRMLYERYTLRACEQEEGFFFEQWLRITEMEGLLALLPIVSLMSWSWKHWSYFIS